jgi:hypothetical protein
MSRPVEHGAPERPSDPAVTSGSACAHLRSKGQYITGRLDPTVEDGEVGDGHCWCNQTQHALGPDDQFVTRQGCVSGRRCFVARP